MAIDNVNNCLRDLETHLGWGRTSNQDKFECQLVHARTLSSGSDRKPFDYVSNLGVVDAGIKTRDGKAFWISTYSRFIATLLDIIGYLLCPLVWINNNVNRVSKNIIEGQNFGFFMELLLAEEIAGKMRLLWYHANWTTDILFWGGPGPGAVQRQKEEHPSGMQQKESVMSVEEPSISGNNEWYKFNGKNTYDDAVGGWVTSWFQRPGNSWFLGSGEKKGWLLHFCCYEYLAFQDKKNWKNHVNVVKNSPLFDVKWRQKNRGTIPVVYPLMASWNISVSTFMTRLLGSRSDVSSPWPPARPWSSHWSSLDWTAEACYLVVLYGLPNASAL